MSIFLASLLCFSQIPDTTQPVISVEPEEPAWGETMTLTYHHDAPKTVIKGQEPLYASVVDGEVYKFVRHGDVSTVQITIPDSVSYIRVYIYSMDAWDRYASTEITLAVPDGWSSDEERLAEMRHTIFMANVGRGSKEEAEKVLDSLEANPEEIPYYYYVLTDGYMRMGYPDSGWTALSHMNENYQGTDEYGMALGAYDYNAYTNPDLTTPERMKTLERWIDEELKITNYVNLLMNVGTRWDEDSTHLTLKEREKILTRLVKKFPYDPFIRSMLASHLAYADDTTAAIEEYTKAINQIIDGTAAKITGMQYVNPTTGKRFLDRWFFARAKLHASQNRYCLALADFAYAIELNQGNRGNAYFEQAKIYQALEHYILAQDHFVKALSAGNTEARSAAEGIYLFLNNTKEGFDEWLGEALTSDDDNVFMTKDFAFTDLDGNPGRWSEYLGKIVVVNAWGLGCGPCKREIPNLNKLVEEYESKEVEFVAFSGSDPEVLKEYLRDHPFKYTNLILLSSSGFRESFRFSDVLPTHYVVDSKGQVRFTRTGAREDNSDIMLIVDQLLREQEKSSSD